MTTSVVTAVRGAVLPALCLVLLLHGRVAALGAGREPRPQHAADGADTRHGGAVTHALLQQSVSDLPAEDVRVVSLVRLDACLHLGRGYAWLAASDGARPDAARLLVALADRDEAGQGWVVIIFVFQVIVRGAVQYILFSISA